MSQRPNETEPYSVVELQELEPVPCPCGTARRAFADDEDGVASLHVVDIREDASAHYHQRLTEIYYVLEGTGEVELNGKRIPVRPGTAVKIRPGCRHRAIGPLRIVNVVVPRFDPSDEWVDEVVVK
jgi:mannose-6-phosphate isomerase-like protein (cupin superfamily)